MQALSARVGSADKSFSENSGKPKKSAALVYGGWFRALSHGSRRVQALPANNPQGRLRIQLVKKGFDKLVDGEASSPATATLTSLR